MLLNGAFTHTILSVYSNTYTRLASLDKHETVGRVNCLLYQFYILYMALMSNSNDEYIQTSKQFTLFMILDMVHYIFYVDNISNYLHHIITILSILYANSEYASIDTLAIFNHLLIVFESTNPPMSISWIANKFGYKDYLSFKIWGAFTFFNWTFIRIFYLSYYAYNVKAFNDQIIIIPFLALNIFWFKPLIKVYLKVIFNNKNKKEEIKN